MKRVLLDEDVPRQIRSDLGGFFVRTVQEQGWAGLRNGELLRTASVDFDVLLTADKNLEYQQPLHRVDIAVIVFAAPDTRLPSLRVFVAEIREAITHAVPGVPVRIGERRR